MPGSSIDVNVHPTKSEVHFLHDEKILDLIQTALDKKLAPASDNKKMSIAPCFINNHEMTLIDLDKSMSKQSQGQGKGVYRL